MPTGYTRSIRASADTPLGAAKRFADDFFWSWWRFEISVFDLLGVRRSERIDETVERCKVATIGTLDGLFDAVVAWDQYRVGRAHVDKLGSGAGLATPSGEPLNNSLSAREHCLKYLRVLSTGDTCEMSKEEGKINLLGVQ